MYNSCYETLYINIDLIALKTKSDIYRSKMLISVTLLTDVNPIPLIVITLHRFGKENSLKSMSVFQIAHRQRSSSSDPCADNIFFRCCAVHRVPSLH